MSEFPPPKYIDDLTCREIYAELVQVLIDTNGLARIELCVYRWSTTIPIHKERIVPVGRVALHMGLAIALRDQLTQTLEAANRMAQLAQAPPASPIKN